MRPVYMLMLCLFIAALLLQLTMVGCQEPLPEEPPQTMEGPPPPLPEPNQPAPQQAPDTTGQPDEDEG